MDRSDVIKLVTETWTKDKYGIAQRTVTKKEVFCNVTSVSAEEFFEGGRNGLNPEFRFTMFFGDYDGQTMVEYNGETYGVYRTYRERNDMIELYVSRKGGTNGN